MNCAQNILSFLCGIGGSLAVDIVVLNECLQKRRSFIPVRYRRVSFWTGRILLAIIGGALAVAYEVQKPIAAVNIGATAPLIIKTLADASVGLYCQSARKKSHRKSSS